MDRKRIQRIKKALRDAKLDALVLRLPENIVMSCGVWPMNGFSYAVVTAESGPAAPGGAELRRPGNGRLLDR